MSPRSTVELRHSWGIVRRPSSTIVLLAVFLVAVVVAALAGMRNAPNSALFDHRRSTYLNGPDGARGLAQALESLGVTVERRSRALFDLNDDTAHVPEVLALLDVEIFPTRVEQRVLADYVREGGSLFLAGWSRVDRCFGLEVDYLRDSVPLAVDASLHLPQVDAVYAGSDEALEKEKEEREADPSENLPSCAMAQPVSVDTLLETTDDRVVAWRLRYAGGGSVLALADSRLVSNELLKTTDAGVIVLPWLLREAGGRVVVDEYHQGFGEGGSIFLAAWDWTRRSPGGWVLLQLTFAGLVALGVGAVRFGPAMDMVSTLEGRRRSAVEHLDALAVGLERAGGHEVAVRLIAGGLRRRLAGSGLTPRAESTDLGTWLESLSLAARTREAHDAVKRLGWLLRDRGGDARVLETASTVEDLWEALRPTGRLERS